MNRIHLLSEQVANQIAAGEVVERPASVVKELVENALDAGATRIHVEIGAGGRALIRVTDDGVGMSRDDALLCLERHATSKIRRAEDLASVQTLGFRGEAIPSIASVSRFSLTTREQSESVGEATQILIHGGKINEVRVAAGPPGTTVEVRQLFFNLPARRKFLRAEETERAHIQHYVGLVALGHPEVAFTLVSDGRTVWQFPPVRWSTPSDRLTALRERLRQVHGPEPSMLPIDFESELDPEAMGPGGSEDVETAVISPGNSPSQDSPSFRLWGLIGGPGVSRSSRESQYLFVNQRPIEHRGLNFALQEGYHTALMKGQYPVCCLFLEIDPARVDVNIHPQKREVKFRDELRVRRLVSQAVRKTLFEFHRSVPSSGISTEPSRLAATSIETRIETPSLWPAPESPETSSDRVTPRAATTRQIEPMGSPQGAPHEKCWSKEIGIPEAPPSTAVNGGPAEPSTPSAAPPATFPVSATEVTSTATPPTAVPLLLVPLRLVGVIGRLYAVFESDRGMVLLDQHAAHERVLFEQMLNRLERSEEAPSQRLLLPETVELGARDAEFLRRQVVILSRLGVGLREFGDRTFLLDALPPFVKAGHPRSFIFGLIDQLKAAGSGMNTLRLGEDVVAKTVCRHAVKANDPLQPVELERLAADLRRCSMPYTCPHGRPTLIEIHWRELEKKFGRTG